MVSREKKIGYGKDMIADGCKPKSTDSKVTPEYTFLSPLFPGDTAMLTISISLEENPNKCAQFWYHIYGEHVGRLDVLVIGKYESIDQFDLDMSNETFGLSDFFELRLSSRRR
jgi:hypothetical protein